MFREMRRKGQLLPEAESIEILKRAETGILGVLGDEGYPYTVPLNYAYEEGKLFFHCAKTGHKLDAIQNCEKVSFCVVDKDTVVPERNTTDFTSVIVFGKAKVITNDKDKDRALELVLEKYSNGSKEEIQTEIENARDIVCMVEIQIEHISGKESNELAKKRKE